MADQVLIIVVGVLMTGVLNAIVTAAVLKTSLRHFEKDIARLESGVERAHKRIDGIPKAV